MPGRKYQQGSYRFGFNGTEKVLELGEGHNTTFFREQDTRIGRWWSFDPRPNLSVSPYAMMEGNPIMYSDMLGDTIIGDQGGMAIVNSFIDYSESVIKKSDTEIRKQFEVSTSEEVAQIRSLYQTQLDKIKQLKESEKVTVYAKTISREEMTKLVGPLVGAFTQYDTELNRIEVVTTPNLWPGRALGAHEFEHAFQYLIGELSFIDNGSRYAHAGILHDLDDEVNGAKVEYLYNGSYNVKTHILSGLINEDWLMSERGIYSSPPGPISYNTINPQTGQTYLEIMRNANMNQVRQLHFYNIP